MPHRFVGSRNGRYWRWLGFLSLVAGANLAGALARADEPLHARIDALVAKAQVQAAPRSSDAEFLRRIYLDLTGAIPSAREARAFLDDPAPDKRSRLIDRLLSDPRHARYLAGVFDVMWMERRGDKYVSAAEWQQFLRTAFEQNRAYDQLVREILSADGTDPAQRGPAKFYLDRDVETTSLTRDVGRMFFGVDLQCAQCHDSPAIDDYLQADYYGIFGFLNRTYLFQPDPNQKDKKAMLAEKAEGDASFKSAFTGAGGRALPRLPGGPRLDEPAFPPGEEYVVKPNDKDKNVRPVPKHSRRVQLAKLATDGSNRAFNRNAANRLWGMMMGRGLVHPPDLHHADNPPAHPELLDLLGDALVALRFDIRAFLRELALSETYQHSIELPSSLDGQVAAAASSLPALQAEAKRLADAEGKSEKDRESALRYVETTRKALAATTDETAKAGKAVAEAKKPADSAAAALAESQKHLAARQEAATALAAAAAKVQESAQRIPADKDLAQLLTLFQARVKQWDTERAAAAKTVDDRTAAAKSAHERLAAAQQAAQAAATQAKEANTNFAEADRLYATAAAKWRADREARHLADRRAERAEGLIELGKVRAAAAESLAALDRAASELTTARAAAATSAAALDSARAGLAQAQKAHTAAADTLDQTQKDLATKQQAAQAVVDAAHKAEQARQAHPGDAVLVEVAYKLKARADEYAKQLDGPQKAVAELTAAVAKAAETVAAAQQQIGAGTADMTATQQKQQALEAQVKQASLKRDQDRDATDKAIEKLTKQWTELFAVRAMEPLAPEQMAWSVMQATGLSDRVRAEVQAELDKKSPLKPEEPNDAAKRTARARQVEQAAYDKLAGHVGKFVQLFGSGPGQPPGDFFATAEQALFFANGGEFQSWLAPSAGNLTERLLKLDDPKALADELYLSVLTRRPSDSEIAFVGQAVAARPKQERATVVQGLAWGLLTSLEFRFNH